MSECDAMLAIHHTIRGALVFATIAFIAWRFMR
jgi:hypothetical protein